MTDLEMIKRECAVYFRLTRNEIEGPQRYRRVAYPRMIAMTLCRHYTRRSMPYIGKCFGDRDHTTVLHGMRRIVAIMKETPKLAEQTSEICAIIESRMAARRIACSTARSRPLRFFHRRIH